MVQYCDKLKQHGKKRITKTELEVLFHVNQDEALFPLIQQMQADGLLQPLDNATTNGNRSYPIYSKYKIILPDENYERELSEIMQLHPLLQSSGYLHQKPTEYRKYSVQIQKLDRYFFQGKDRSVAISRKERSFEIFSEEKELDSKTFCGFLAKLGLNEETLNFYDTPEYCFNDFIPERKSQMTLLICENKDIWFNIRRMMFERKANVLFGVKLDGVVLGCGNKISQKNALQTYTNFMGDAAVNYLYWGDIDRAGLNIYLGAKKANPDLSIALFIPAYEEMLRLARGRSIPDSEDHRELECDYDLIYRDISEEYREEFVQSICENKRLPQEIIPYTYLLENMRESNGTTF